MPCPFPGMDPFIENDNWQDFHLVMTAEIKRQLAPQLPERYRISAEVIAVTEEEEAGGEDTLPPKRYRPDVGIGLIGEDSVVHDDGGGGVATLTPPTRKQRVPSLLQREVRIYLGNTGRLVTAIEVLSPSNKNSVGLLQHVRKLRSYRASEVNTLDIDLLRAGQPPYDIYELPLEEDGGYATPYHVVLSTPPDETDSWDIGLTDRLPTVPVPLLPPDKPLVLNLQKAFTDFYAYSTYPVRTVTGLQRLRPALSEEELTVLRGYLGE